MTEKSITEFRKIVWDFYKKNKRSFPWRSTQNPYHILISEIMLQQTQADRVVSYYERFIKRFPDFKTLAKADFKDIYPLWQGLGYNRRAMALKKLAEIVVKEHQDKLPSDIETLITLPGIGPYTARAIVIFSHNSPLACIETNIRRVFIHSFLQKKEDITDKDILLLAEKTLDVKNAREWNWALMDYGAHLKKTTVNANRKHKDYAVQSKFEGSGRQIRGAILRNLASKKMTIAKLIKNINREPEKIKSIIVTLEKEELIVKNKKMYSLT